MGLYRDHKVKGKTCETLCITRPPCAHWHGPGYHHDENKKKHSKAFNKLKFKRSSDTSEGTTKNVNFRFSFDNIVMQHNTEPANVILSEDRKPENERLLKEYKVPDPIKQVDFKDVNPKLEVNYFGDLALRRWSPGSTCKSLVCTVEPGLKATLCFQKVTPESYFQFGQHPDTKREEIVCD